MWGIASGPRALAYTPFEKNVFTEWIENIPGGGGGDFNQSAHAINRVNYVNAPPEKLGQ